MPTTSKLLDPSTPQVVGSFGDANTLRTADTREVRKECDWLEIRLDLIDEATREDRPWNRFSEIPLLFTARRASEGGQGNLDPSTRSRLLRQQLDSASLIDIEVASIEEMRDLIDELNEREIPWIGSFHEFDGDVGKGRPDLAELEAAKMAAQNAGAIAFKAAIEIGWQIDAIPSLARFISITQDFPVALMGMGPLAPASRLLFAQLGSVLNYGYLGTTPTAPGQWSARQLKHAITSSAKKLTVDH